MGVAVEGDVVDLRAQAVTLRRRWRTIALMTLLGLTAALALAYTQTPKYIARADVLVDPLSSQTPSNGVVVPSEEVSTQLQVLGSEPVAEQVIDELRLTESPSELLQTVTVIPVEATRVLTIEVTRTEAQEAADVANAFADEYLIFRQERAVEQAEAQQLAFDEEFAALQDELASVTSEIQNASGSARESLVASKNSILIQLTQVAAQTSTLGSPVDTVRGGEVLRPATRSDSPAAPRPIRLGVLGAVIGLLLGIGLAFVRDRVDDAVRDEDRLREVLDGRPVLGHIPRWGGSRSGRIATLIEPHSPVSEAYRALSTNVRFLLAASTRRTLGASEGSTLMVSSAEASEGKTSVAANLAVAAARVGLDVIVVDADLRHPMLSEMFGVGGSAGLSDVLATGRSVHEHVLDVGIANLRVLPGGSVPPNPAELLASPGAHQLLNLLRQDCDLLILDSAPILRVADSLELVTHVDLVLLVARNAVSRLRNVSAAVGRVKQVGGVISGAVFNDVAARASSFSDGYHPPSTRSNTRPAPLARLGTGAAEEQSVAPRERT
ncbi:MAG: polysaccharide biosynthesis tyrosine autokinase [Nocardioidaceae bacterium]|nr:polysaccharide biosynthesis tyrosine autokinase [Nocardioidaceae bacterium]